MHNAFCDFLDLRSEFSIKQDRFVQKLVDIQKYITDNAVFIEEECFGREINNLIDKIIKSL